jgi:O-antigen/teichoic acid export membrane protein
MSIKQQTIRGAVWISISSMARQLTFLFLSTVLYRLLVPADFGTVAMATVLITAMGIFQNMGIGAALIHRRDQVELAASTAFYIYPLIGLALALIGWMAAGPMADFFRDPVLKPAVRVMAATFVPTSFCRVFQMMMEKRFEYLRKMWAELASTAAFTVVALVLAFRGWGVWSLIWGYVAQELVLAVLCTALCSFRPRLTFSRRIAGELLTYGTHLLGAGAINFLINQGDRALISRMLGKAPLGYYSESYKWGSQPIFQVAMVLTRVTFPAFSELQDKPAELKDAFMRTYFLFSWLGLPFFVGVWFLAPELATVIFGARWDPLVMVPLLRVVALYGTVRTIQMPTGSLFQAVGKPHYLSWLTVARLVILVAAIYPMTRAWGLLGAVWAVTGSFLLIQPPTYRLAGRVLNCSVFSILRHLRAALLASAVMAGALWGLGLLLEIGGGWSLLARLLTGAGIYFAVLLTVSPASRGQMRDIVGTFFK